MPVDRYDAAPADTPFKLGLHHILLAIPAGSEDECRAFYVGVLGLTEVEKPADLAARGGLWVRGDNLEVHLGVEEDFTPQKKAHPGILVQNLNDLAARVEAHGLTPKWDDGFPGMRRFYLNDNNGNRLEFLSPQ
ncbi:catechol 2,3-dioxygenase-like lactoylglutathione lyase family enzyme [Arthrobacter pigmenti]|uniref:Catechol 2,3-dioxygenase-like lactoylglutathione lyase family enzyme n=1 Tax=Arthrobacter pigmenti TaxID=271432 RepID=A0A846RYF8_9MICC|nr:VOC family protein [Arthrobacter pigmenti]NJC24006.1 catechol 2,3-dioxygenase-like lactoylglutathione lyase family enzyme [Arthrobacter pigmenti]